jgi:lactoylglutathione lyase
MKFVHAATRTADLGATIRFYAHLGLHETRRVELEKNRATLVFLEPPERNFAIELVYNWGRDAPYEGGERFGHFAFSVNDLDGMYERLLDAGGGNVGRPPAPLQGRGNRIAFVADPDGTWIELIEHEGA